MEQIPDKPIGPVVPHYYWFISHINLELEKLEELRGGPYARIENAKKSMRKRLEQLEGGVRDARIMTFQAHCSAPTLETNNQT